MASTLSQAERVQNTRRPSARTPPSIKPVAALSCSEMARVSRTKAESVKSDLRRRRVMELCGIDLPCWRGPRAQHDLTGARRPARDSWVVGISEARERDFP